MACPGVPCKLGVVDTLTPPLRLPSTSLQELARADEAWQLRWATETARLQGLHGEELVAAAAKHRQVRVDEGPCCAGVQCAFEDVFFSGWLVGDHCAAGRACLLAAPCWGPFCLTAPLFPPCLRQAQAEADQRHANEVCRLKDAIATLEKSERQLLKARAVLEARVEELGAEVEGAQRQAAAAAQSTQLAVDGAVAAATTELQCQVGGSGVGGGTLGWRGVAHEGDWLRCGLGCLIILFDN